MPGGGARRWSDLVPVVPGAPSFFDTFILTEMIKHKMATEPVLSCVTSVFTDGTRLVVRVKSGTSPLARAQLQVLLPHVAIEEGDGDVVIPKSGVY